MRVGILADTHDELTRTRQAIKLLSDAGAEALIHCGDLFSPSIVEACAVLPLWFVLGNHDSDTVPMLQKAAIAHGANCLGWGGVISLAGKRIGITHGHMTTDVRTIIVERPDYLLSGHSHMAHDRTESSVRRINPGALHRADDYTVAILDLTTDQLSLLKLT